MLCSFACPSLVDSALFGYSLEVTALKIVNLYPGGFACNCYLVLQGEHAVLVDCSAPAKTVKAALTAHGARLQAILCTHGHFDHVLTADDVRSELKVPLYIHEDDAEMLTDGEKNAFATFFGFGKTWRSADRLLREGDTLSFGELHLSVLHTPGHSKGSSVLLCEDVAFTGDTLFANGYGRTDLYGGDHNALRHSLERLYTLPDTLTIYPGHGDAATLKSSY